MCILFWIALSAFAQQKEVLISIGNKDFFADEFERIYKKNNINLLEQSEKKTPEEYLDLFINFKLKVIEAENLKMDTAKAFIDELAGYQKELAVPYLTDISFDEKMVEEMYKRLKSEVRASQLLITIGDNQSPEDTLKAYNKIMGIREKIIQGLDFKDAAYEYSEDPSAKSNRGDLGYFSAFQMVYPFEDAVYNTPKDSISMPVRTSFGYHILKVEDKRDALGEIKVAHIMKMFPQNVDDTVLKQLKTEIDSIYSQLINGADFATLAKKYSDDKRSSENGGELAWFSSGNMIVDFADQAFALKHNGDISKPIMTQFGYHIIKRLDLHSIGEFNDIKKEIENRIKNDPARSNHSKSVFINKLKSEYGFKVNEKTVADVKNNIYEKAIEGQKANNISDELFVLDNKKFTAGKFFSFLTKEYPDVKNFTNESFYTYFNQWVEKELTAYEDSRLEEKYPDFKYLLQEYHDGILLFNISDKKIWSNAVNDSAGLQSYYEKNKGAYLWGDRFKGAIITCDDQATRDEVEKLYSAGMTKQEILDRINKGQEKVKIEEGAWEKNSNPIVNFYVWNGKKPDNFNEELVFIHGDKVGPEPKLLHDARGLYLSDYQNYLEKEWIKNLRDKYKIKVNTKLLKTIENASK